MMSKKKVKKNQHYVPQSYLRRFTIDGEKSLLWSFDKDKRDFLSHKSSVKKVCSEDYYYYQVDENGDVDHIKLEDSISYVEKIGNDILIKIIGMHLMPFIYISEKEKGELAFYIALMMIRGPSFRDVVNGMHGWAAKKVFDELHRNGALPEMPVQLQKLVDKKGIDNVIKMNVYSSVSLDHMIKSAEQIAESMLKKKWIVFLANKEVNFVTSDTPVSFYPSLSNVPRVGPAHHTSEMLFPISKKLALVITPSMDSDLELQIKPCNKDSADHINSIIVNAANKWVFCSERHDWLFHVTLSGKGQKVVSGVNDVGFSIINNPYRRN